jgi:hypothetical protein
VPEDAAAMSLRVVMLGFAGIALLVGVFLIHNTFAMLTARRTREIGLMRALGAGRGHIARGVLAGAFALGALGALEIRPANGATWTRLATLYGEDPSFPALLRERYTAGDPVRALSGTDAIVVAGDYARAHGLRLGDAVRIRPRGGGRETTLVVGALRESDPPGGSIGRVRGAPAVPQTALDRIAPGAVDTAVFAGLARHADRAATAAPCVVPLPTTRK